MNDLRRLLSFVRPHAGALAISFFLLACAGFFEVLTTALAIPMFDDVLVVGQQATSPVQDRLQIFVDYLALLPGNTLTRFAIALVLLTVLKGLCLYRSNIEVSRVGQSVIMDLRNRLYAHVLRQSMGFFGGNSTGALMSRMNSDVEQVQEAVSTSLAELFREVVLLVWLVAWVFYIDWKLALLALIVAPAALVLTLTMGKAIRRVSLRSREGIAGLSDMMQQSITGIRIVKAFGMEPHEEERLGKASLHLFKANMKAARILFMNSPIMELLGVVSFIPLLVYAHNRIVAGSLTLGSFGSALFSLFRMYDPIRKLSRIHVQFQRALASSSRIAELFDTHSETRDRPGARELKGVREGIGFRDVWFSYRDASGHGHVLEDISLDVRRNQIVALVGSSGSGKSTLVSLIPRFYDVQRGAVSIDGIDVRDYTQDSLRRSVAVVTQETFLFNESVRQNIAYGDPAAGEDRIMAAARAAFAHEFIMQLPRRYDTVIGERGQRLSGGERQRISIARAVLKNAPILILDEATSALDSESEKLVQEALANLMHDRTTFVIAHRLSTVRNADVIVVLDQGRIRERGTHEELVAAQGLYYRFLTTQNEELYSAEQRSAQH